MTRDTHRKHIFYALNLAKKHLGITSPNPVVACIIVKNKNIIASGVTGKKGRPHAERIAIDNVKNKELLKDSTIYVTLEPCAHFGKTSPCVDEIIKYPFKEIVIATQDPNKKVDGKAIKKLQDSGIITTIGVMEKQAKELNKGFFKVQNTGLPYITCKIAISLDGKIATKYFDSKWISNEKSRQFAHHLRSINDGILVGKNTFEKDQPKLDCRIKGLEEFSPQKIIMTTDSKFRKDDAIIINGENLVDELKNLAKQGINSILLEGGGKTITTFLKENLIDELILIRSSKIIGNDGIPAFGDLGFEKISQAIDNFVRAEIKEFDKDLIEIYTLQ